MKPPTWDELEAMVPWAHIELVYDLAVPGDRGELVIYTGLTYDPDNEPDGLVWMPDMAEMMEDE